MRRLQLNQMYRAILDMTWSQRRELMGRLNAAQAQDEVRAIVEDRLQALRMCPHCHGQHVVRNGMARGLQRYKRRVSMGLSPLSCSQWLQILAPEMRADDRVALGIEGDCADGRPVSGGS